jgi:hypothetical protein
MIANDPAFASWADLSHPHIPSDAGLELTKQSQAAKVVRSPATLNFDDAPQCAETKSIRGMVERKGHAATIGMAVMAVTSFLPLQAETIHLKCGDELTGGNGAESRIINGHTVTATTG